jgi:diguanylate cyclase (GGDEF)-like protein
LFDSRSSGLDSLEIVARVKASRGSKQTWMILLSSAAEHTVVATAAAAGIDDMLLCGPGESVGEIDLRVRLGVAARALEVIRQLESQLLAQTQAASFHASHDHLTGLLNRESLLSMLFTETDRVQRMNTPLGLMVLDLDHFSRINEDYGYDAGDKVLQELSARLRRHMRSYDLIGRCDADEFLIVLPGCPSARAMHLAQRIRTILLHRPFSAGPDLVALTASIGLAQSRGRSPLVVLREAERALTAAKAAGRNCEREYVLTRQKPGGIGGINEEQSAPMGL